MQFLRIHKSISPQGRSSPINRGSPMYLESDPGGRPAVRERDNGSGSMDDLATATGVIHYALGSWKSWYEALKRVLPIYIATHMAFLLLTYVAPLFTLANFSPKFEGTGIWLHSWYHWDSGHFVRIATTGYHPWWETAFFPLYPLLERALSYLTGDPFVAGLIISNMAGLCLLVVLYRLVLEDFDAQHASRTVLYLAVFPTAFFLAAGYNESLFLCLALLSFYHMRHGHWWLAGLFGFLSSLTRSAGLLLLLPFCYEYLCQHPFNLRKLRFDVAKQNDRAATTAHPYLNMLSAILIPAGVGVFALYCYMQFHDPLAFSHAQGVWRRSLSFPGHGPASALRIILTSNIVSFVSIHNVIDLDAALLMLVLVALCFVGPWKFPMSQWAYGLYAAVTLAFFLLLPTAGGFPLQSVSRLVLEIFPAFVVLATIGKKQQFSLYYLMFAVPMLSFLLLQFLTGHWVV